MNQTPAAILVLSSTVMAYSATVRAYDPTGLLLGLAGLVLGVWSVISLIGASIRDRELLYENPTRSDFFGMLDPRRMVKPAYGAPVGTPVTAPVASPASPGEQPEMQLSPEVKAQLSMAAHLEGRDRSQIVEEALRRYLPRYERTKAA